MVAAIARQHSSPRPHKQTRPARRFGGWAAAGRGQGSRPVATSTSGRRLSHRQRPRLGTRWGGCGRARTKSADDLVVPSPLHPLVPRNSRGGQKSGSESGPLPACNSRPRFSPPPALTRAWVAQSRGTAHPKYVADGHSLLLWKRGAAPLFPQHTPLSPAISPSHTFSMPDGKEIFERRSPEVSIGCRIEREGGCSYARCVHSTTEYVHFLFSLHPLCVHVTARLLTFRSPLVAVVVVVGGAALAVHPRSRLAQVTAESIHWACPSGGNSNPRGGAREPRRRTPPHPDARGRRRDGRVGGAQSVRPHHLAPRPCRRWPSPSPTKALRPTPPTPPSHHPTRPPNACASCVGVCLAWPTPPHLQPNPLQRAFPWHQTPRPADRRRSSLPPPQSRGGQVAVGHVHAPPASSADAPPPPPPCAAHTLRGGWAPGGRGWCAQRVGG